MPDIVFQVSTFRGMKKGRVKWNAKVSFHFKQYAKNVVDKIKCNMILSTFTFYLQLGDVLAS